MVPDTFMPSPGVGVPLDGMNEEECGSSDSVGGLWLTGGSAMFEWWQGLLCKGTPVGPKRPTWATPRETFVFQQISINRHLFNRLEISHAVRYIRDERQLFRLGKID